jgi:hypothetical protein
MLVWTLPQPGFGVPLHNIIVSRNISLADQAIFFYSIRSLLNVILTSQYTFLSSQYNSISISISRSLLIFCVTHPFHFLIPVSGARMTFESEQREYMLPLYVLMLVMKAI